jgi:NlpC/P60 family putative phage cell wall peptidase
MAIGRDDVIAEARRWIKTPWHHQGALRGIGCDCIGLIAGVAEALGLPEAALWRNDLRFRGYGRLPEPAKLLAACDIYLDRLKAPPRVGDVLLMTFYKEPMHFAFVSNEIPRRMIHAYQPIGEVVEHVIDEKWQRRVVAAFGLKGIA